jgi:hypothetical protein
VRTFHQSFRTHIPSPGISIQPSESEPPAGWLFRLCWVFDIGHRVRNQFLSVRPLLVLLRSGGEFFFPLDLAFGFLPIVFGRPVMRIALPVNFIGAFLNQMKSLFRMHGPTSLVASIQVMFLAVAVTGYTLAAVFLNRMHLIQNHLPIRWANNSMRGLKGKIHVFSVAREARKCTNAALPGALKDNRDPTRRETGPKMNAH